MARCYIGIDPGLCGAVGVVDPSGAYRSVFDLPFMEDKSLRWIDAKRFKEQLLESLAGDSAVAFVERVSAMPKQGVASSFTFGVGYGSILSLVPSMGIPMVLVTSTRWKPFLKLTNDKKQSLSRGRMMFPEADLRLAKHDGRAESLLIAYYGMLRGTAGFVA